MDHDSADAPRPGQPQIGLEPAAQELQEWQQAMDDVLRDTGKEQAVALLRALQEQLARQGLVVPETALNTPYRNTIGVADEPQYPGDIELERRLENIIRWNAVAMVLQAQDAGLGLGGHIATYLSCSTLMEVGLNHVWRAPTHEVGGDLVSFQAHAAPGVYARAFLEGRLSATQLRNFRRELAPGGGLSSYPHPRRLPEFWQMPCASMGLSTPSSIYLARFAKYLENRGLKPAASGKIWTFIGDGEADEPEVLGTINVASREKLDNLVVVVNCNLQRLDGPVRGNGKIIQELERAFRGADWEVIKVVWGGGWDALLDRDEEGILQRRMDDALDGDYQYYTVSSGDVVREHWVDTPELRDLMKTLSNEEIRTIRRGGHDHRKIYAAFDRAREHIGKPIVILAKTVKGEGLGPGAEGRNTVHQKKSLSPEERVALAERLGIPLPKSDLEEGAFYRPAEDSPELEYLRARREALGGPVPQRRNEWPAIAPAEDVFAPFEEGSERPASTTMVVVRMLGRLLRDKGVGKFIVPIVPDEARTFGMDGLFPQAGIYAADGQRYTPVDAGTLVPYKEASDGQILQEGICETGAMASFMAAGTAYANHGLPMIPFYIFYSMFGFQRVGDMIWACGDMLARGFLLGGTSGRTTLNGEGVQHQDGHSQLVAATVPNLLSYDPAFGYELAVIIRDGIRRMYADGENIFYYLTVTNQVQSMPPIPSPKASVRAGIVAGMYQYRFLAPATKRGATRAESKARINLFGSGAIMVEVEAAADYLQSKGHPVAIYSVTSYNCLVDDLEAVERARLLAAAAPKSARRVTPPRSHVETVLADADGVFVAACDYMKAVPARIGRHVPGPFAVLGTDGYGLSESRAALRDYFEVSAGWIAFAALSLLQDASGARAAAKRFDIDLQQSLAADR